MTSVVWHINVSGSTRYQLRANLWDTEVDCVLSNMSIGTPTSVYISACWWLPEAYPWNQSEWILSLYKSDRPRNKLVEIMQHAYRHYIANADSLRTHESHVLGSQESQSIQRNRKKMQLQHYEWFNDAPIESIESIESLRTAGKQSPEGKKKLQACRSVFQERSRFSRDAVLLRNMSGDLVQLAQLAMLWVFVTPKQVFQALLRSVWALDFEHLQILSIKTFCTQNS